VLRAALGECLDALGLAGGMALRGSAALAWGGTPGAPSPEEIERLAASLHKVAEGSVTCFDCRADWSARMPEWAGSPATQGVEAWACLSLGDGRLMCLWSASQLEWEPEILEAIAAILSGALGRVRALERARQELDAVRCEARREKESLALLSTLYDKAPVGLGFWDRELHYTRVNEALARMNGLSPDAHLGRPPWEAVPRLSGNDQVEAAWRHILATGELVLDREISSEAPGESRVWTESWYPVHLDGEVVGVGMVVEEITDRKRAEADRAALVRDLQAAIEARDEFLSIASHELKTPLTALQLQVQRLLRMEQEREVGMRAALESAERSIARLGRLVNNLLDVSQVKADRLLLEMEQVDLAATLREVAGRFKEELVRSGSALTLQTSKPVAGWWDRLRIEQIASNLLSNAVKFGGGRPIEASVEERHGVARLVVRDHGLGIPPEDQQRVFRRFERGVSARHFGGLGLGLWVARRSAEALGGAIHLASEPGVGSVFAVDLPLRGPVAVPDRDEAAPPV